MPSPPRRVSAPGAARKHVIAIAADQRFICGMAPISLSANALADNAFDAGQAVTIGIAAL